MISRRISTNSNMSVTRPMRRLSAEEKALKDLKTMPKDKLISILNNGRTELDQQVKAYNLLRLSMLKEKRDIEAL